MKNIKQKGFTLLEMILVLAVMGTILGLIINYGTQRMDQYRRDRAALQMQQILNAGLAYYVQNGVWPVTCGTPVTLSGSTLSSLQTEGFLPNQAIYSPWPSSGSGAYQINCGPATGAGANSYGKFSVSVTTPNASNAQVLAGQLPMATISTATVTAEVPIPGQNLNNARSVNYAGVYNSGACVPVPTCPTNMTAQIFTSPQSVAGVYDAPLAADGVTPCTQAYSGSPTTDCASIKANPITSYQAYAVGGTNTTPAGCTSETAEPCYLTAGVSTAFSPTGGVTAGSSNYWRVCLKVGSESGDVNPRIATAHSTATNVGTGSVGLYWTQAMGQVIAFTRCVPSGGEPTGSSLNIWGP